MAVAETESDWTRLTSRQRAGMTLAIAASLALLAGLVRSALAIYRWSFTQRISYFSRDIIWMAPLGTLLLFAGPALLLALLAAARPRFATLRAVLFTLAVPAMLSVLLLAPAIHDLASLVLAIGISWRLASAIQSLPRVRRVAVRSAAALSLVTLALFGAWRGAVPLLERWRERRLPAAAAGPNVVLVILDAVRAKNLSLYGYARPTTPGLERLAREATVFDWAIAPSSWTLPSHGAFFTGRWPGELSGSFRTRLDETYPTVAEILGSHGYRTGGFAANSKYATRESGLARGFQHYDASHPSLREIMLSAVLLQTSAATAFRQAHTAGEALSALLPPRFYVDPNLEHDPAPASLEVRRFLRWQARSRRPFFAYINLFDAHAPYVPPEPWPARFGPSDDVRNRYDGAIAYEDTQLSVLVDALRSRGLLENTVVIIAADHGELFGEHGLYRHNNGLYIDVLHVPLLIRFPRRLPAGARVDIPVGLRRLPATVLDLVGLRDDRVPGPSLDLAWRTPDADSGRVRVQMGIAEELVQNVPAAQAPLWGVVERRWHYIHEGTGHELLYDYRQDPGERHNLAGAPGSDSVLPRLRALVAVLPQQ